MIRPVVHDPRGPAGVFPAPRHTAKRPSPQASSGHAGGPAGDWPSARTVGDNEEMRPRRSSVRLATTFFETPRQESHAHVYFLFRSPQASFDGPSCGERQQARRRPVPWRPRRGGRWCRAQLPRPTSVVRRP
jgi:hypothetical protein